ncbi:MAG: bifunctional phosphoribosyl-AMP cyclohydrolase/phosphoribosyl-ATP diphosphatase HisIE [Deltaproteobacteria bacterium]|nr:bifunctional phosphoribosyl-AMP cyclohydrolase/phosphoribosyl-ATP diphosphatase HisIE [Deltaproteobacteria bacterium]
MKLHFNINIKFDEKGLVPAVVQEYTSSRVLMLAYMNKEALEKTISTGIAHYFSRSRNKLWMKGETSGNTQSVKAVYYDCDEDTILLSVHQTGVACHTGEMSCFYRRLDGKTSDFRLQTSDILSDLFQTIKERKTASPEKSYVASLYSKGKGKILAKIKEESSELIEAAGDGVRKEIIHETADLWFHTMVLLGEMDIELDDVLNELKRRQGVSGIEEKEGRKNRG